MGVRASVEETEGGFGIVLGAAWRRDCGLGSGIRAALAANPAAGAFFDGLAQFYRRAFLQWIDGTKRRPEERARRIAEVVDLLERGDKQRS